MSTPVTFNNTVYPVPVTGDINWGPALTRYLVALGTYSLSPAGGTFTLTADVNFGNNFGLISKYLTSESAGTATAGMLRLAHNDIVAWRNAAGNGNLNLTTNGSDQLTFNGTAIQPALTLLNGEIWIGNASNLPIGRVLSGGVTVTNTGITSISSNYITDAMVNGAAAIAYSKLNLSGSILNSDIFTNAAIDASKIANGTVSNTEFQYLAGVTSAIQTQINSKQASGNYITALTGDITATGPGSVGATLATVNGNVGSFGSSTSIPSFTVNAKGLITAASGNVVIAPAGTLTGTTLASNVVTSSLTSVGTIASGTWQGTTMDVAHGGSGTTSHTAYAVITGGTTSTGAVQSVASVGTSGQVLTSNGAGALPTFQTSTASGVVNAGTAGQGAYYAASAATVSGTSAFTVGATGPNAILVGTNTNNSAAAGVIGEYISATYSAVSVTNGQWGDGTSISLTAGDWDVTHVSINSGGVGQWQAGISTSVGNSSAGLTPGDNEIYSAGVSLVNGNCVVPAYRMSLSGTTTVYAKLNNGTSSGTPNFYGRISARRVR